MNGAVGDLVVLKGTIIRRDGDVALVEVEKSYPPGGTVVVRLGKFPPRPPKLRPVR
jgi:hypothetical protein